MFQGTFTFARPIVIALAAVLLTVAQGQAAPPAGASSPDSGFRHGGNHHGGHHHHGFHHGRRFPGYFGFYGYPYANIDYVYAVAREQQYRGALLQAEQFRAVLLQVQWAALQRAQADQLRSRQAQPTPPESSQPAHAAPRRVPSSPPAVMSPEKRAAAKLRHATIFAEDGQTADATDYFREIVQKYPETVAARHAQQFLDKANQR